MRAPMNPCARALLLLILCPVLAWSQAAPPSPLASEGSAAQTVPGGWLVAEGSADRALQAGFPDTAALLYRELLADEMLPADTRGRVRLALVSALLDAGEPNEAEKELLDIPGPRGASYQLRVALIAAHARRIAPARTALAAIRGDELTSAERGWWFFVQAQLVDLEGDIPRANGLYDQAVQAAVSEQQRARFLLEQAQAQLRVEPPNEARLASYRANMEQFIGTRQGHVWVRTYATALHVLNRPAEARAVLQRQLAVLAPAERETADQFRLLLGLISGEGSAPGRAAFRELLRAGLRPDTQRIALYALARGARTPADRAQLRRDLTELISAPTRHPVIEDLLLVRAQAALADRQFNAAEEDARLLLDRFPGSPLKAAALGVRLAVAWEARLYRTAADVSTQLRAVLPPGRERSELGVLLAEAFFRSGDFKNAADAYEAALREAPQVVPTGALIFQRVLADVRADRIAEAVTLLDEMAGNSAFDPVNRWQAEWNLVREMQARGRSAEAQARVELLSAGATAGLPEELQVRFLWLRAKLSFDNARHEDALRQADELIARLGQVQLDPALATEVASTGRLLKAQALFELGRDAEGAALLDQLRVDFRGSRAALYSYLVQASRQARRGELATAQKTLTDMVDGNRTNDFAAFALFEAAAYAERQGLDRNLREAYTTLERLVRDYPRDELVFYARLKQGDLLRKLNDFGAARLVYEDLINNRGQHPDILLAQLALADSLFAQGANNPGNYESAAATYERLRDLPTAPVDLRVEAGYKWGYAQARRGQAQSAQAIYWGVVDGFLLDATAAARLGATGRYWLSRTLLELGQLLEEGGRLDEAQRAYRLVLEHKLGGAAQAQARIDRYRGAEGTTP